MNTLTYTRYELLRTIRNRRFMVFSLAFPILMFMLIAGPRAHVLIEGTTIPYANYYMAGMAAWGAMTAVLAGGARIAMERTAGWQRLMRITPLPLRTYFATKVVSGYMMALITMVLLAGVGTAFGARLTLPGWLGLGGMVLVGLIPFAVMGILMGHLLTVDSMGPALGGVTSLFAVLGGSFGQVATSGALHTLSECLPSYWLVQAGSLVASGEGAWPGRAWVVIAVWTLVLARGAMWAYQRDTERV